jgi:hypothetical protein
MKITYLYAAINDVQSAIRSFDIRAGFLFLILFAPAPLADKLIPEVKALLGGCVAQRLLVGADLAVWGLALFSLFMAVAAIISPAKRIAGPHGAGTFYGAGLFRVGWVDAFWNRPLTSTRTVAEEAALTPAQEEDLIAELAFEKMKLAYIRDLKAARYGTSVKLTALWAALSLAIIATTQFA